MKQKTSIEHYNIDEWPKGARKYFKTNGFHFNKKACEEAVKGLLKENPATKKLEPIDAWDKEQVDDLLKRCNVVLEDNSLYDYVWVANMVRSDYWKSSITDEQHLALMVKDIVDDPDQRDGFIFNRWIGDRLFNGRPIDWEGLM